MQYRLKDNVESFEMVDGPFAGRKYVSGEIYTEIPPNETVKFDEVLPESAQTKTRNQPAKEEKAEVKDA